MARTVKGRKGPGYEYWTRRPGNRHGGHPGALTKKVTHRAERRLGRDEALAGAEGSREPERDDEVCEGCPKCMCRLCGGMIAVGVNDDGTMRGSPACVKCGNEQAEAAQ